ncbi:acyl-CoA dehydrogenase [Novosphingobium sp. CF614]|uniref:acyl-CoA dehydrogenase family protein n=1 Tax=Novosphingobium sp. CF614 TaxID=1884364 RepID=UPI0008F04298|nr:acyl-CoA dehydrogenase family protein [Novosphingobium sp. CF614]SFF96225.1 acyl-CoA dehydrogenase [Novosphingobium sp. CF614]
MKFRLDEDQQQLQATIGKILAADRIQPRVRAVIDGKKAWDEETWQELVEFGLTAIIVPEENDGMGLSLIELAICAEELGRSTAAVPFLGHVLATIAIVEGGSEEQKARLLPGLASGEVLGSIALTEGNDTWAPADWRMAPEGTTISGRKRNVPNGDIAQLVVVGIEGGRLGVVEMAKPGVSCETFECLDLTRPICSIDFDKAEVELLQNGPAAATRVWDAALALLSADAYGGAWKITEMARDYVQVREAFGAKLAEFQAIKHQLANVVVEVEPTRGLYWFAAYTYARMPEKASHAVSLAKAQTTEVYDICARMCTELHGGIGFTWEFDAHVWLKRAMFDTAWGGRPQRLFLRATEFVDW